MATRAPRLSATSAAYVLHRYDWSESSLILDLFTRDHGRIAVAAKGAKRPYSQLRSVLLPFQRITVTLGKAALHNEASSDVQTLRGAEWAGGASMLTGAALFSGFYLNELLMKLTARHDPHPALFDAYAASLPGLAEPDDASAQAALRAFELTLLARLGLLPELGVVTSTQEAVRPDGRYVLRADTGVVPAAAGEADLGGSALVGLQAALEDGRPAPLQQACRACLAALRVQLRNVIQYQLGNATLRTRHVMMGLQSL